MAIGIWNTAFLGDAVLTLPLIQTVFRQYPDDPIHFFVRKGLKPLFEAHPAIAAVHEFDKAGAERSLSGMLRFSRIFTHYDFRLWISAHTSLRSAFMARLSRAKTRIGYKPEFALGGYAWAYTDMVPRCFGQLDEIERLLQLVAPLGIVCESAEWPEIVLPQASRDRAEEFWAQFRGDPVLGVHPGSVWATKRWPLEYFATIIARAAHENAHVLIFGGPGAEEGLAADLLEQVRQQMDSRTQSTLVHNLAGKLSLPDLAAYLALLNCYLTNDSGPMHLAWPQLTPIVALFGPTTPQLGFAPRGPFAEVLEIPLACRPCGKHGHKRCPKGHFQCMCGLLPDIVWDSVRRKLFSRVMPPAGK